MSYEQKARAAFVAAGVRIGTLTLCPACKGLENHDPHCRELRVALLEQAPPADALGEPLTLEQVKSLHVARVLREKNWNKTLAAKALAIDRRTLYHLIQRYGIEEQP